MNIFEAIIQDHKIQRGLADRLIETQGDTEERDNLYQKLKVELKAHAAAEERFFYVPLIMEEDETLEKSRHGVAEHHELDEMIANLDKTDYSSPGWLVEAKNLQHKIHHHLEEEEKDVFKLADKVLTDEEQYTLAVDYQKEIDELRNKNW